MRLAYVAHSLNDPTVSRRLRMLRDGGCTDIAVLGFRRQVEPVTEVGGFPAVDLGRTADADLLNRAKRVAAAARAIRGQGDLLRGRDVFMGRNIEALLLAHLARRRFAPGAGLVYECLDIHRLFLTGRASQAMRGIEGALLRRTDLVVVSSPDYDRDYFGRFHGPQPPRLLVENKVIEGEIEPLGAGAERPAGPPWRIGWFGALRCRESLLLLSELARALDGAVEVVVRGTPVEVAIPDFAEVVDRTPHMTFLGRYDRARDLSRIYSEVHFAWSIDRFEAGLNTDLALSNRLYEATACGTALIADPDVAMGRWLAARGTGVLPERPTLETLLGFFRGLDGRRYAELAATVRAVPVTDSVAGAAECQAIVAALEGARAARAERRRPSEVVQGGA